jgi:hypothetical protein
MKRYDGPAFYPISMSGMYGSISGLREHTPTINGRHRVSDGQGERWVYEKRLQYSVSHFAIPPCFHRAGVLLGHSSHKVCSFSSVCTHIRVIWSGRSLGTLFGQALLMTVGVHSSRLSGSDTKSGAIIVMAMEHGIECWTSEYPHLIWCA